MESIDNFYKSKRWELLRQSILRRDNYQCKECRRYGRLKQADHVHHIFPREQYPQYQWQTWNLICLCKQCHDKMHYRTNRELTARGEELLKRTARRFNIDYEKD